MKKNKLLLCLIIASLSTLTHCTSKQGADHCEDGTDCIVGGATQDNPDDTAVVASGEPNANGEAKPAEGAPDLLAQADAATGTDASKGPDSVPPAAIDSATTATPPSSTSLTPAPEVTTPSASMGVDSGSQQAATPPPISDAPVVKKASGGELKKIEDKPFKKNKILLNAVYLARSGDTLDSISAKIYGSDKSADLKKANSYLAKRQPKPGDKVYYNSPKRPEDDVKIMTYFEDEGIAPVSYITKKGDSMQSLAKKFFGNKESWKELWATNAVDSKWKLPVGTELRYWEGSSAPIAKVEPTEAATSAGNTANTPPPPDTSSKEMPQKAVEAQNNNAVPPPPPAAAPPPPPVLANVEPPPPPPPAAAAAAEPPPPPPPPVAMKPPPPPPPPPTGKPHSPNEEPESELGIFNDPMTLGVIALVIIGLAAVVVMIVKRKKAVQKMEEGYEEKTHVG